LLCLTALELEAAPGSPLIVVGQQDGSVVIRDVTSDMAVAATLHGGRNAGHTGEVRTVLAGPSDYFFTGGNDGRFCVWQAIVPGADGAAAAAGQG
jgi:WD40 repeat protein